MLEQLARRPFSLVSTRPPFRKTIPTLLPFLPQGGKVLLLSNVLAQQTSKIVRWHDKRFLAHVWLCISTGTLLQIIPRRCFFIFLSGIIQKEDETALDETLGQD